jgi:hypothetical protein
MRIGILIAALILPSSICGAGREDADTCARALPPNSRAVYGATVDEMRPGANNRQIVMETTDKLVGQGRIAKNEARPAAEAAGKCLMLLAK